VLKIRAQLGFCSGNSGDPIFTETFGTGTSNNNLPFGTTNYTYVNGFPNDGNYTVSNGTFGNGFDWHQIQDHTSGDINGKCFIVNAVNVAGEFYNTTITGLCENTTYEFSAWLINLVRAGSFCSFQPGGTIPIDVRFEIWDNTDTNLLASGNTGNIIETSNPVWGEYGLVFQTLTNQNSVILKMINNGQGGCGNDLAIDDIEFKTCGDTVTVSDASNNSAIRLCSSQTPFSTTLVATPDGTVFSSHFYQWQESTDANVWTDITNATSANITVSGITTTTYYRSKVSESLVNLNNSLCNTISDVFQITVNQAPVAPTTQCWETANLNTTTCSWEITGTQPIAPTGLQCWETATFNTTSCVWDVTGTQPIVPIGLQCWETTSFNTTTCSLEIIGAQPVQPAISCWETATFNNTTCTWEVTGTQPAEPTGLQCWETTSFNTTTCAWDVTGTQSTQPTISCWESTIFNTSTCVWDVTGTQPAEPATQCWETSIFNIATCLWDITGTQPVVPKGLQCWETATFNTVTCVWEVVGTQPGDIFTEDLVFCLGETPTLYANASIPNPKYLWSTGETTEFITVNTPNIYSVEITSPACFFETRTFNVTQAAIPSIDNVASDGRNIVITTSNIGDFVYSLDGDTFQSSNTFFNAKGGMYTIYVKENNCSEIVTATHLHFYIPKFFTPNNDGDNDTFNLSGIEIYGTSQVSIFNRYGKLMKSSNNGPFAWNGTFNSELLPTDDYWYVIIIDGQKFTGHFTLKR
jgi:gliding motility-associated-like protein